MVGVTKLKDQEKYKNYSSSCFTKSTRIRK